MLNPQDRLAGLAAAIADGLPADWESAESSATDDTERALIRRLRAIGEIARLYDTLAAADASSLSLQDSTFHPSTAGVTTPLRDDPVAWGPLRILEKVGRGRFGDVYRAWDPRLDREVALKLLRRRDDRSDTEADDSLVIDEGRLMARVRHTNVATIYGAERIDGRTGLWMEFVEGRTLEQELRARGPFDPEEVARVGIELCRALAAVHDAGLLHRDVKAQNVMREAGGRLVLSDFGTGRELEECDTAPTELAGTPLYLAPEIFAMAPATPHSDLYSLGVLLFHLATGAYPVSGRSFREIRDAHTMGRRVALLTRRADCPAPLAAVIEQALAADAAARFKSAREMERALADSLQPPSDINQPSRGLTTKHWLPLAAAAVVALLVAVTWRSLIPGRPGGDTTTGSSPVQNVSASTAPATASIQTVPRDTAPADPALSAPTAPLKLNPRDWILVASFENRTGEAILGDTVDAAVKRELEYSFVTVAQKDRVEDALRLLNRPFDSRLDPQLAREVSQRDGGIRALLSGQIEKRGTRYVITSEIVNPTNGVTVSTVTDEASGQSEILAAVRQQVFRIREALGEQHESVETSRQALAQVTLPSLRALQLYAQAARTMNLRFQAVPFRPVGPWRQIEQLARDALQGDPNFAPALTMMAWAISRQQNRPRAEYLPYAERALQFADTATPQERYFITGSVHHLRVKVGNSNLAPPETSEQRHALEQAVLAYEALLALQPDHYELLDNLREVYRALRRDRELASMTLRIADARPKNVQLNLDAAKQLVLQGNFEAARRYAARAEAALSPGTVGINSTQTALVPLFGAYTAWLQDDPSGALKAADDAASKVDLLWVTERGTLFSLYLALGRLNQAQQIVDAVQANPRARVQDAFATVMRNATLLRERRDQDALRKFAALHWSDPLGSNADPSQSGRIESLVEAGLLDAAERDVEWFKRRTNVAGIYLPIYLPFAGAIEIARGRPEQAIPILQQAMAGSGQLADGLAGSASSAPGQLGASKLAEAWEATGNLPKAIETLVESGEHRLGVIVSSAPDRWMRGRAQLARLYRKNGQDAEARTIEAHLLKLLAVADPDYPLLLELRARR